jgi:hypothetical protein
MERTIINFKEDYFYPGEHTSSAVSGILYLAGFLCIDVGSSVDYIKKAFNDPSEQKYEWGYGGYSHIEQNGNNISIGFAIDQFYETPGAPVFTLTLKQMNYILDRWKEALEKKPNKIVITKHDNDEITVDFEE